MCVYDIYVYIVPSDETGSDRHVASGTKGHGEHLC